MGGDSCSRAVRVSIFLFQSTPPHGGRPLGVCSRFPDYWFQSTPPHGGRLLYRVEILGCSVSIHAPAWGATPRGRNRRSRSHCFNPRPRMGGDIWWRACTTRPCGFNPRPRMGGDGIETLLDHVIRVSIHAPAWGATTSTRKLFIPFPFQSTPPHGGRRQDGGAAVLPHCFNPRPRMGGDINLCFHFFFFQFQSTPPHGGRHQGHLLGQPRVRFQSTPPHGGRRGGRWRPVCRRGCFNPRPRMGGDCL